MSVDTQIEGSPGGIETAATWLRGTLAPALESAADQANAARSAAASGWSGEAGSEFRSTMSRTRSSIDDLEGAAKRMADDLDEFAAALRRCQNEMSDVRAQARDAGLTVVGFVVQDPGPGPARPPDGFVGTEAEVAAHDRRVEAYDLHQDKIRAYNAASTEADRIDRVYETACRALQDRYTVGQHAAWLLTLADIVGDGAAAGVAASITAKQTALHSRATALLDDARAAITDMQANPDRYMRRKWFFFRELDTARLEADRLAIQGRIDEAEDLIRQSRHLDDARAPRYLGRLGRALGPLGLVVGVANDYQAGETPAQIATSQGVSFLAGMGTGAAAGAAIGSVVPVAGTAVGAVVGTAVGAGVAIFSDGAIDSLFENGPDVGEAFSAGIDALADTGSAIASGVSGAASTVKGWFS